MIKTFTGFYYIFNTFPQLFVPLGWGVISYPKMTDITDLEEIN